MVASADRSLVCYCFDADFGDQVIVGEVFLPDGPLLRA